MLSRVVWAFLFVLVPVSKAELETCGKNLPLVANTWGFTQATEAAWAAITSQSSQHPALDAVEQVSRCLHRIDSMILSFFDTHFIYLHPGGNAL